MISLRKFIVFLMFSAFLGGCQTPFIDIDIKHSAGGAQGSGPAECDPILLALGLCIPGQGASLPLEGKVTAETIPGFKVETTDGQVRTLPTPPFVVVGDAPKDGETVIVTFSNREIRKK